jgi:hypothetical protein
MGRYSTVEPDEKILESLKGSKSALIVGCTHCANISIAYDRNLPIFHITHDKKKGIRSSRPVAVVKEAERLKRLLESHGVDVCIEAFPLICAAIESDDADILVPMGFPPYLKDRDVDAALALTCTGEGLTGVKRMVRGGVKAVPGMRTVGGHEPVLSFDAASGDVFVDRDKSVFKRRQ